MKHARETGGDYRTACQDEEILVQATREGGSRRAVLEVEIELPIINPGMLYSHRAPQMEWVQYYVFLYRTLRLLVEVAFVAYVSRLENKRVWRAC